MEDRLGELYLEMTNLSIEAYEVEGLGDVLKREDVELATHRPRRRLPRLLRSHFPEWIRKLR